MRILLDECVPSKLWRDLPGHQVDSIRRMRWTGTKNGALLKRMEAEGFDVLLTVDKSLPHQQNLHASTIAVILIHAISNRPDDLRALMPQVLSAIESGLQAGVTEIFGPDSPSTEEVT